MSSRQPATQEPRAVESLRLAEEELRQQNEQLLAAQLALENERRRYQELFEFAPCGYIVTDPLGIIQEMNRRAELLLDHRRELLRCKPLSVLLPKEARPSFFSHLHRLLRRGAGEVETWETLLVRAGAAPLPVEVVASAVLDAEGRLAGLRWLVRDVSDRKQVEQALATERDLMDVILRGTADGLVVTDRTGSVILINEVARTILPVGGGNPGAAARGHAGLRRALGTPEPDQPAPRAWPTRWCSKGRRHACSICASPPPRATATSCCCGR